MTVAFSDGAIARAGGKVIKNVAGYDLGKLVAGSFGTLGMILSVSVRLHPLPPASATTLGVSSDPEVLAAAARSLAREPLELEALDVAWHAGRGGVLARSGGVEAPVRAEHVASLMLQAGLESVEIAVDDAALWARQRAGQRSEERVLVRVAARPSALAAVVRAAQAADATLVGRITLGRSYVELEPDAIGLLERDLPDDASRVLLDAPGAVRAAVPDPWGKPPPVPTLELMRSVKARFDPAAVCNPGVFVGGI
jgi:glycolate oxidase FAD binding subunit